MEIRQVVRARELFSLAAGRELDESELQEAMGLVESLVERNPGAAAQAYGAIRYTFVKRGRPVGPLRALERRALDLTRRSWNRRRVCQNVS